MRRTKQILKRMFCLPPLLTVVLAAAGYLMVLAVSIFEIANPIYRYMSYLASAYALIISMAAYSFYIVITAIISIVKTRRHQSPILSAAKAINLVTALVSILSLTTAMLTRFGGSDTPEFRRTMTAWVGGGVCTIVILIAIFMLARASKNLKKIRFNNTQT